jgi:hypothetical protein
VWVVNSGDRRVVEYDPRSGKILQSVPVGNGAGPVATGLGAVWVVNSADGSVQRIDTASGRVSRPISVGAAPSAIAVGGGAVWVTDEADGLLARIDEQTLQVTRLPVGQTPAAVAFGDNAVWVANTTENAVTRVLLPSLQIDKIPVTAPSGIAFNASAVWVASRQAATLTRIDPASAKVSATIDTAVRAWNLGQHGVDLAGLARLCAAHYAKLLVVTKVWCTASPTELQRWHLFSEASFLLGRGRPGWANRPTVAQATCAKDRSARGSLALAGRRSEGRGRTVGFKWRITLLRAGFAPAAPRSDRTAVARTGASAPPRGLIGVPSWCPTGGRLPLHRATAEA